MPPRYEIRVGGVAERTAVNVFAGLDVRREGDVTIVRGEFDQAALHGLLERIRSRHLDLLDVRRSRPPAAKSDDGPPADFTVSE